MNMKSAIILGCDEEKLKTYVGFFKHLNFNSSIASSMDEFKRICEVINPDIVFIEACEDRLDDLQFLLTNSGMLEKIIIGIPSWMDDNGGLENLNVIHTPFKMMEFSSFINKILGTEVDDTNRINKKFKNIIKASTIMAQNNDKTNKDLVNTNSELNLVIYRIDELEKDFKNQKKICANQRKKFSFSYIAKLLTVIAAVIGGVVTMFNNLGVKIGIIN